MEDLVKLSFRAIVWSATVKGLLLVVLSPTLICLPAKDCCPLPDNIATNVEGTVLEKVFATEFRLWGAHCVESSIVGVG